MTTEPMEQEEFLCRADDDCPRAAEGAGFHANAGRMAHERQSHDFYWGQEEGDDAGEAGDAGDAGPAVLPRVSPDDANPQPLSGIAEGNMTCAICRAPIMAGENYIQGMSRGATHPGPCSNSAD